MVLISIQPLFWLEWFTQLCTSATRAGVDFHQLMVLTVFDCTRLALAAEAGTVIVEIQDGAQKVVNAVGQFANQLAT